jgi:hypothetical protein
MRNFSQKAQSAVLHDCNTTTEATELDRAQQKLGRNDQKKKIRMTRHGKTKISFAMNVERKDIYVQNVLY